MTQFVLGVPPAVLDLVQQGLLERAFHDGLAPALMYRSEAQIEEWAANTGTEIFMTRPGLLAPITQPLVPGVDPVPQAVAYEQWSAILQRFAGTIDTHVPTSVVSNADQFIRNIHQLGVQAGMSLNRIPRNALFSAYLSGQTTLTVATASGDQSLRVSSVNGFTDVIVKGQNVRPAPVSASNPLAIKIGATSIVRNVVGYDLDNPSDPKGPGTLFLDATVGAIVPVRGAVLSSAKPAVIRSGGGDSIDAIAIGDIFTLQDAINATNRLRKANVSPHADGWYHAHINTDASSQIFADPAFQRLNTSLPDGVMYQEAFVGQLAGIRFFQNTESPDETNSGLMTSTGTNALYAADMGGEVRNEANVGIGRVVVTGRGALYEKYLDEGQYVTEAGITGKTGEFQVVNNGVEVSTDKVRLVLRAPINRLQDQVSATWAISTSFPVPSDITSGGPERFKRAIVIEHALG